MSKEKSKRLKERENQRNPKRKSNIKKTTSTYAPFFSMRYSCPTLCTKPYSKDKSSITQGKIPTQPKEENINNHSLIPTKLHKSGLHLLISFASTTSADNKLFFFTNMSN